MKKTRRAGRKRSYPAHFYRLRRDYLLMHGVVAVGMTVVSVAMLATGESLGVIMFVLFALPCLIFVVLNLARKRRMYLCVDRDGVELGGYFHDIRCDWDDIDDIWMTQLPVGFHGPKDAVAVRLRGSYRVRVLFFDMWDDDVESIYLHIVRYRLRYGNEVGAAKAAMALTAEQADTAQ